MGKQRKQSCKTDNWTAKQQRIFRQAGDVYNYIPYKNGHQS